MRTRYHSTDPSSLSFIILLFLVLCCRFERPHFTAQNEILRADPVTNWSQVRSTEVLLSADKTVTETYSPVKFSLITDNESASIRGYDIEFGDGDRSTIRVNSENTGEGVDIEHVYEYSGNLTVKARCIFDNGTESNWTRMNLVVLNQRPLCSIRSNVTSIYTMDSIKFTCIDATDMDGNIDSCYFDFGDGEISEWFYHERIIHVFQKAGKYTVQLRVEDNEGAISKPANLTITVLNRPPVAIFHIDGPEVLYPYVKVLFAGHDSYDRDGMVVLYEWTFGDGRVAEGVKVTHGFSGPGDYTVKLLIEDNNGSRGYTERTIQVVKDPGDRQDKGLGISRMSRIIGSAIAMAIIVFLTLVIRKRRRARKGGAGDERPKILTREGDRSFIFGVGDPSTQHEIERDRRLLKMYEQNIVIPKGSVQGNIGREPDVEIYHETEPREKIDEGTGEGEDDGNLKKVKLVFKSPGHYKEKMPDVRTKGHEWAFRKKLAKEYAPKRKETSPGSKAAPQKKPVKSARGIPSKQKLVLSSLPKLDVDLSGSKEGKKPKKVVKRPRKHVG